MSDSPPLFGTPREWATDMAIATAIGVFLGVIGPFGSFNSGPAEMRIAFWTIDVWIGFIVISTTVRLSMRAALRFDLPAWFALPVGVAIGCGPLMILISLFSSLFWPSVHSHMGSLLGQYGQILAISEPCAFAYYFLADRGMRTAVGSAQHHPGPSVQAPVRAAGPPAPPILGETSPAFLDRLPPRLGRDLICLQMEDHYVRAHTPRGSDLILIPLKDAIAELSDTEGLQVHRSWWVARRAVTRPVASGRNLSLNLSNGLEVPVSRASVAKLRAAGWLDSL